MDLITLRTSVETYLNAIVTRLAAVKGPQGHGLFVNNHEGTFVFDIAPMVSEIAIVASPSDETQTRAVIEATTTTHTYYDLRDNTRYTWDGVAWSSTAFIVDGVFREGRFYFSPYTHRVFYYTIYGKLTPVAGG